MTTPYNLADGCLSDDQMSDLNRFMQSDPHNAKPEDAVYAYMMLHVERCLDCMGKLTSPMSEASQRRARSHFICGND